MNPFEFVIAVLFLVFAFALLRHKVGMRDQSGDMIGGHSNDAENARLRGQVEKLQDRIRILERIVTDGGVQTAAQIEALRDRDKIAEKDQV